jgi:putative spermidine/putrescine transport system ATP-binding protein
MAFLELNHVSKIYPNALRPAVEDFNLRVEPGEFVSFLGPSGCGKTTTLRMVAGFEAPSAGEVLMDGKDITNVRPNQREIGMVFQSYALFPNMSVADNIGFGLKVGGKPASQIKQRVTEMLALIKLEDLGARYPFQLSGGQQQRVALARALAIRPKLLLLDEPLSALDAKIRVALRNEIREIQRRLGITTIYVTHDQEEALSLSDRVVVMNNARVEQVGAPFEIYNFPKTRFVASFVGTLNTLTAIVADPAAGLLTVQGQPVYAVAPLTHVAGAEVALALRPELLVLRQENGGSGDSAAAKKGGPQENQLTGLLENITFLGSIVRMQVRVGDSIVLLDEFNNPHLRLPKQGETVTVAFGREACLVLDKAASAAASAPA